MNRRVLAVVSSCALAALAATANAQYLLNGDFDSLTVGTNPDTGSPAGSWQFPVNYVFNGFAENRPDQYTIVGTSSFDVGATGNSLRLRNNRPQDNLHLPSIFGATYSADPTEFPRVSFDMFVVPGKAGGTVYLGADNGGGGYNSATDRGPQVTFFAGGNLAYTDNTGANVNVGTFTHGAWQRVQMDINLNANTYALFLGPRGGPLTQVGSALPFRASTAIFALDRFTFAYFGSFTADADAYIDNCRFDIVPAPGAAAVALGLAGLLSGRRRR